MKIVNNNNNNIYKIFERSKLGVEKINEIILKKVKCVHEYNYAIR